MSAEVFEDRMGTSRVLRGEDMLRILVLMSALGLFGTTVFAEMLRPAGGGSVSREFRDHLTEKQRAAIVQKLTFNRSKLLESGVLKTGKDRTEASVIQPLFDWPTTHTTSDPGYFGISGFVDHDEAFPDWLSDYNCGTRTYDTDAGYNHKGIDVFSWPYPWMKMDNDEVQIIAAEPGVIIGKSDGNFDRNCSSASGNWNAVYVEHADGSVAWYGHLKKNSLTPKLVGESVQSGEYLGIMGSSGRSTGPHLHLEVYDSAGGLIDPSSGACNKLNVDSWWNSQRPYYEPTINMVATHDAPPVLDNGCGVTETPNFQTTFQAGERAYFALYLRDQQAGQQIDMKIIQPDGKVWREWSDARNSPDHYSASWWYWVWDLPADPQAGNWRWNVHFQGQEAESEFTIADTVFSDGFEELAMPETPTSR